MDAIEQAKAAGITEVQTFAGWTPIDAWKPYGNPPSECSTVAFVFDADRKAFRETLKDSVKAQFERWRYVDDKLAFGLWPVR